MRITRLGRASTPPAGSTPTPSSAPSTCCASTAASWTATASTGVRMTATSAARDAANRDEFFDAAEAVVGVRPELLSRRRGGPAVVRRRHRRARPGRGPVPGRRHRRRLDRVRRRHRPTPEGAVSIDMGCVRLTEKYLHHDPPHARGADAALSVVDDLPRRRRTASSRRRRAPRRFVGLAGTVTTVAAVELGLADTTATASTTSVLTRTRPRTCSARWPPSRSPSRVHNRGSRRRGPT